MADPVTIGAGVSAGVAILGMVTSAAGAATQAAGAKYQGEAQANMYTYQAGVARVNAQIAKQNADYSRSVGEIEAQESGMKTRYEVGEEKTVQAASGLDINKGTSADVRASQIEVGQQDQAIIRAGAAKRAFGYDVEAFNKTTEANIYDMGAKTSRTAGDLGMVSSILGGASSVSSKWLQYQSTFGNTGSTSSGGSSSSYY